MRIGRYVTSGEGGARVGLLSGAEVKPLATGLRLSEVLHGADPRAVVEEHLDASEPALAVEEVRWLCPLEKQEVWGAGVTYERSKVARQEESESGGSFYDQVYRADRPELFLKATPSRVVGPGEAIRIRADTAWAVPEPELALVLTPELKLVGYTIGNDVSARDIEGRNPLYLPQAKVYEGCCALGPVVTLAEGMGDERGIVIGLRIEREGKVVFEGETSTARMARRFGELVDWLGRDNLFPDGVFLLTGTGVVPPDEFSLKRGDEVSIEVAGIGVLRNWVDQREQISAD